MLKNEGLFLIKCLSVKNRRITRVPKGEKVKDDRLSFQRGRTFDPFSETMAKETVAVADFRNYILFDVAWCQTAAASAPPHQPMISFIKGELFASNFPWASVTLQKIFSPFQLMIYGDWSRKPAAHWTTVYMLNRPRTLDLYHKRYGFILLCKEQRQGFVLVKLEKNLAYYAWHFSDPTSFPL